MCAFKDVCSRRIVGQTINSRMKASLPVRALGNALLARHFPRDVVIHSDRGSQFRCRSIKQHRYRYKLHG
jgi:transposase InsO family protein